MPLISPTLEYNQMDIALEEQYNFLGESLLPEPFLFFMWFQIVHRIAAFWESQLLLDNRPFHSLESKPQRRNVGQMKHYFRINFHRSPVMD